MRRIRLAFRSPACRRGARCWARPQRRSSRRQWPRGCRHGARPRFRPWTRCANSRGIFAAMPPSAPRLVVGFALLGAWTAGLLALTRALPSPVVALLAAPLYTVPLVSLFEWLTHGYM